MNKYVMDLQMFAEEGGAAAAPAGGGAETGTAAESAAGTGEVRVGDTLADGSQVADAKVAAALNRQMKRHPEMRKVYGQGQTQQAQAPAPVQPVQPAQPGTEDAAGNQPGDLQARWDAMKKGEFRELFAKDQEAAIKNRFKNQEDASAKLAKYQKVTDLLMKKAGFDDFDQFSQVIENDDSIYEEDAEAAGMPVEAYKEYIHMKQEHDLMAAREQQAQERERNMQHIAGLRQQAEEFKKVVPGFDLQAEMQNEKFFKLTAPGGISVKEAYYAIHGDEMIPQALAYGMQRAQQQMGQTIQAQRARPAEGAMSAKNQAAAQPTMNPASMSKQERRQFKEWVRRNGPATFDGERR